MENGKDLTEQNNEFQYPDEPPRFGSSSLEAFIMWAVDKKTSDVTIQNEDRIMCEIHGKKRFVTKRRMTRAELTEIISTIYKGDGAVSKLNGGEDVDLPWSIRKNRDEVLRFRVNMTPIFADGANGYSITIRTITNRAPLLETLNLPQQIIDNISPKQGLVIITGATGSGKSTLLASVLDWRMRNPDANLKILTYEAPIEYVYDDVPKPTTMISQSEIGTHLGSFALGVRNALRRKPDIILMGEMRDRETIGEGVVASQTGHLVYGTLHSNGVSDTVRRMVNTFEPGERNSMAQDILGALQLIVGQMLLPSTDGKRVAIREYLVFTQDIRDQLLEAGVENLTYVTRRMLLKHGQTFLQDAELKFKEGFLTQASLEQVRSITKEAVKDVMETMEKSKPIEVNETELEEDAHEENQIIQDSHDNNDKNSDTTDLTKWEDL